MLQTITSIIHKVFHPPQHLRLEVQGDTLEDCLRNLERQAKVPVGDFFVEGEPESVVMLPARQTGKKYIVVSKVSEEWREAGKGYIAGSIFEPTEPMEVGSESSPLLAGIAQIVNDVVFYGSVHVSKNCPGVYRDNVCTTCGDVSH
ncbi:hypothetical protein JXR01_02340 [Candidatus Kaiserbacteria bacterium]|nr:MAG: hypothetical protein JXR01_02340 [Candidatus Kaiserbacteria bacterium]